MDIESSEKTKDKITAYVRERYAIPRKEVEIYLEKLFAEEPKKTPKAKKTQPSTTSRKPAEKGRKTTKKVVKKGV